MEKKEYSVTGLVTIGSDEYRALVRTCTRHERCTFDLHEMRIGYENDISELRRERVRLDAKLNSAYDFIKSDEEIKAKYKLYLAENKAAADGTSNKAEREVL